MSSEERPFVEEAIDLVGGDLRFTQSVQNYMKRSADARRGLEFGTRAEPLCTSGVESEAVAQFREVGLVVGPQRNIDPPPLSGRWGRLLMIARHRRAVRQAVESPDLHSDILTQLIVESGDPSGLPLAVADATAARLATGAGR